MGLNEYRRKRNSYEYSKKGIREMNLIKIDNKIINLDNVNYIVETDYYKCDFVMNNGMRVKTSSDLDELYDILKSYTIGRK